MLQLRPLQQKTCPRCGNAHDFSKSWCGPCTKAYNAEYRANNRARLLNQKKDHYENNKNAYISRAADWKKNNKQKVAECSKKYYSANKGKEQERLAAWERQNKERRASAKVLWRITNKSRLAFQCRTRQALKVNATPAWANLEFIKREYELASWCSSVMGQQYHVDHIIPLKGKTVCGLHVHENLRVIPAEINLKKGNRYAIA